MCPPHDRLLRPPRGAVHVPHSHVPRVGGEWSVVSGHCRSDLLPAAFAGWAPCQLTSNFFLLFHKKSKGKFLYSAVFSPQDRSKHFTLHFPDRPVHSDTISTSLGSIQPYATINARRLLVHISTTVYSQVLIYSAE